MEDKTALFVGGHFDDSGGSPSKIADLLFSPIGDAEYLNGGSFEQLKGILGDIEKYKVVYWFADVPNDREKIVREVKPRNPACVFVTSKRNTEGKYSFADLIYHALGLKSNLFVEFTQDGRRYRGRVADPLGNVFLDHSEDFGLVGKVVGKRTNELVGYTRVPSTRCGDAMEVPDGPEFFELVREYASEFHNLIHTHPEAVNRFLGNASFRCEKGFPSFRDDGIIFVSRRNVDKRGINRTSFVAVKAGLPVEYFGEHKPSVDTPVQIRLYGHYAGVRYMLHSHTYIEGAPFTRTLLPCGAVEEADEVFAVYPDENSINFPINIVGHGSLMLTDRAENLRGIPYRARPMPEVHREYAKDV